MAESSIVKSILNFLMLSVVQLELTSPEVTLKPFYIFHIKEKGLKMYKKPWSWLSQRQHGGSLL